MRTVLAVHLGGGYFASLRSRTSGRSQSESRFASLKDSRQKIQQRA